MSWDVVIAGLGVMGSAASWELARRGARVLCVERQGRVPHARGSSHGETRVIRRAYFEDPSYVPLIGRAYAAWDELSARGNEALFERVGVLVAGPPDGMVVRGVERASAEHGVPVERIRGVDIPTRFPGFAGTEEWLGLFEPDAGFLHAERCVAALLRAAREEGATVELGRELESFHAREDGVEATIGGERVHAGALVIAGGAWSSRLLAGARLPLAVSRKVLLWMRADAGAYPKTTSPVFAFDTGGRFFYGFPSLEPGVVKLAEHSGGDPVTDPDTLDRTLQHTDVDAVAPFVRRHMPRLHVDVVRHAACMYTMTPDAHFIVDRAPDHPRVVVAGGFSGHGFKMAPTIGALAADLALEPAARPLPLFAIERFVPAT